MSTPHNRAQKGDFAATVLMPGDPLRAKFIADTFLENPRLVTDVRGMLGFTGTYEGRPVSVMGSGMGMPSIGIYSYELYTQYGVENIIRIGSAGSYTDKARLFDVVLATGAYSESSYAENLEKIGYVDFESPDSINLYAASFADKDEIARIIDEYNAAAGEEQQISYTDYVAILMSSISTIINAISYVLIAFVAISLVVSSIMIGIITYISVLERTKEIGILRAIGASKRDVSNVFNAETLIEGLAAGLIGIGMTLLLTLPINAIVQHLTGISNLKAILPAAGAVILIFISMLLTFIAGLIPSRFAARRDPVEALRTE